MKNPQSLLLVVDDEPINLIVIEEFLDGHGYQLENATGGEEAWEKLQAAPDAYGAILLDRMMPGTDGMELLRRIKQDQRLRLLPVILQTAVSAPEDIAEGLSAGAFYYLTKPFDAKVLCAVVATALRDRNDRLQAAQNLEDSHLALNHIDDVQFAFRTTESARQIAAFLSCLCPSRQSAHLGLVELLLNAIEHGNLGITYDEKSELIAEERLNEEIKRRLALPVYAEKVATVRFKRIAQKLVFSIEDQGNGFDWERYLDMSMERIMDNHGRGIVMARHLAFSNLQYFGSGNRLEATITSDIEE